MRHNRFYRQSGLSLVELMITMLLGLMIIGMMGNAYLASNTTSRALDQASLMTETGRYVSSVLKDEIQVAGAFGIYDNRLNIVSSAPKIPDPCTISSTSLSDGMAVPITGYNNVGGTGTNDDLATVLDGCFPSATESVKTGTDVLILRRTHSDTVDMNAATPALDSDTFYVQSTSLKYVLDDGSSVLPFSLTKYQSSELEPARRYLINIFYVSGQDNQLKKLQLNGDEFSVTPIADNIEDFQVEYGIDSTGNGAVNAATFTESDGFTPGPKNNSSGAIDDIWSNVVAVRALTLVRSDVANATDTDTRSYTLGHDKTVGPFNDNFKRRLFYFSSRANNLSIRREGDV